MSWMEDNGYKLGDRFEVTENRRTFTKGSIIEFCLDDGTDCPKFKWVSGVANFGSQCNYFSMPIGVIKLGDKDMHTVNLTTLVGIKAELAALVTLQADLEARRAAVEKVLVDNGLALLSAVVPVPQTLLEMMQAGTVEAGMRFLCNKTREGSENQVGTAYVIKEVDNGDKSVYMTTEDDSNWWVWQFDQMNYTLVTTP